MEQSLMDLCEADLIKIVHGTAQNIPVLRP
jgi:hypothetical protein